MRSKLGIHPVISFVKDSDRHACLCDILPSVLCSGFNTVVDKTVLYTSQTGNGNILCQSAYRQIVHESAKIGRYYINQQIDI